MIKVGTDIVHTLEFKERFEKSRWKFERDVFFESEFKDDSLEHLAGIFAAKEAVMKALDLAPGSWKSVQIEKLESGKPKLILHNNIKDKIKNCDVSISHAGDYAIAVVICSY